MTTTAKGLKPPLWRYLVWPVIGLAAGNALVFVAWTLPRANQRRTLAAREESLSAYVAGLRADVQAMQARADAIKSNNRDADRLYREVIVDRKPDLLAALAEIEGVGRDAGVQMGTRTFANEPVKDTPVKRFAVSVPVKGSYDQLAKFLRSLERSPHFVSVDRIAFRSQEGATANLDMGLSVFYRGES